jgi:quinolinate synthase
MGECHVHAGIRPADIDRLTAEDGDAELLVHPECGCASQAMAFANERTHILSTEGMIAFARTSEAPRFRVATETGVLHGLRKAAPLKIFEPVRDDAVCRYMKMITLEKVHAALGEWRHEVRVPAETAELARKAIERMVEIG